MEEPESTTEAGQYLLTTDDAELLQEILNHDLSHQGGKRKFRFQDLKFTWQLSTFQNLGTTAPQFHGFFVLFWMGVTLMFFRLAANTWRPHGSIWGKNEIIRLMMDKDVMVRGLTNLLLCWSTGFCLILQRVVLKRCIRWNGLGWLIQNIWQTTYLGVVIWWTYHRDWPWTHTVFIVLHCLAMLMKQHSYAAYNGYLSEIYRKRNMLKASLGQTKAKGRGHATSAKRGHSSAFDTEVNAKITDLKKNDSNRRSSDLQNYTRSHETDQLLSLIETIETGVPLEPNQVRSLRELLEQEIEVLSEGLKGRCSLTNNHYPQNLTIGNICDFMSLPTLVYELEYPRTKKIGRLYVAEKTLATFGIIVVMMAVSQSWIYPVVMDTVRMKEEEMTAQQRLRVFPWVLGDLLFSFMMEYLLAFYLIWECVHNAVAEITMFADRGLYSDWWNSVSWDQFARDWNRPVHNFLFRHVYHGSIHEYRLSRPGLCDVAYVVHPSFVDAEVLQATQGPLSIAAAETDSTFSASKSHEFEDILAKTDQLYQINLPSGVEHGFAAVAWFDQYL
ncbi:Sterol O-acyltransferase, ACAT/DAG/ARE types [Penicillium italicum]|uniref:Sterol O-acyltransferase, ACAT/DAG/ARE types n=1 Tax=Penicillium italicum TaxID=40296 RepID=A0A0A2KB06_PENIT|nr:Sterol O-acyltransferase, ACAT/DAG/ARE types [Penicillium italicum]